MSNFDLKNSPIRKKTKAKTTQSTKYNYCTDSSDEVSDSDNEIAQDAIRSMNADLKLLENDLTLTRNENLLLKDQIRVLTSEKSALTNLHKKIQSDLEQQNSILKLQISREKLEFQSEISKLLEDSRQIEQRYIQVTSEKEVGEKSHKKQLEKLKKYYSAILEEKDKKIKEMYLLLQQTKKLDLQVKELLDPSVNRSTGNLKKLHSKSKSYIPTSGKLNDLCKTIVSLEREQAGLRQDSSMSQKAKNIMKSNEEKLEELRSIQEQIFKKKLKDF